MSYRDIPTSYSSATSAELKFTSMISGMEVKFPAFLTAISQNFKSSWQTENVFGRNDPIATFQNTTRTVSLSWAVPAASLEEAKQNEIKISKLITFLYPGYSEFTPVNNDNTEVKGVDGSIKKNLVMSKSPLIKIKFANVIQAQDGDGLLGWIDSIDWKPKIESGMFVSGREFYAKSFELSVTLNVLHQKDVGVDQAGKWLGDSKRFPFKLE